MRSRGRPSTLAITVKLRTSRYGEIICERRSVRLAMADCPVQASISRRSVMLHVLALGNGEHLKVETEPLSTKPPETFVAEGCAPAYRGLLLLFEVTLRGVGNGQPSPPNVCHGHASTIVFDDYCALRILKVGILRHTGCRDCNFAIACVGIIGILHQLHQSLSGVRDEAFPQLEDNRCVDFEMFATVGHPASHSETLRWIPFSSCNSRCSSRPCVWRGSPCQASSPRGLPPPASSLKGCWLS